MEEIYQNKNYLPPKEKFWETIFEKPELEEKEVETTTAERDVEGKPEDDEVIMEEGEKPSSSSPMQEDVFEEEEEEGNSAASSKEIRTSSRRPQPPRTNLGDDGNAFSSPSGAGLVGTRKLKRKADFLATKAKTLKRKQKVKKTEGKYKIPSASKMETIEEKFREKMRQLAAKCQGVEEEKTETTTTSKMRRKDAASGEKMELR